MTRKRKQNIEVRIVVDTREKDLGFLQDIRWDRQYKSDKIMISGHIIKICKPLYCTTSTGDLSAEYRYEGETNWKKTKLSIELKKGADIFGTLYSSMKRFSNELDRAEKANLDFYILTDWDFAKVKNHISTLQKTKRMGYKSQPYYTFLNNYLDVSERFPIIQCGSDMMIVLRRIIKRHIKEYDLHYKPEERD